MKKNRKENTNLFGTTNVKTFQNKKMKIMHIFAQRTFNSHPEITKPVFPSVHKNGRDILTNKNTSNKLICIFKDYHRSLKCLKANLYNSQTYSLNLGVKI